MLSSSDLNMATKVVMITNITPQKYKQPKEQKTLEITKYTKTIKCIIPCIVIIPSGKGDIRNQLLQNDSDANVMGKI